MMRTRSLSLILVLGLVLAACGGGSDPGTTNPGGTQPGTTTTVGPGGTAAPTTTPGPDPTGGPGDPGLPGPGAGDSWWEVDGTRYEVEVLVRCERVIDENFLDAPAHDDDLWVIATTGTQAGGSWLFVEYTGADGFLDVRHARPSADFENADALFELGDGASRVGERIRGGPFAAELTTRQGDGRDVPMSLDVEILPELSPAVYCEGLEDL